MIFKCFSVEEKSDTYWRCVNSQRHTFREDRYISTPARRKKDLYERKCCSPGWKNPFTASDFLGRWILWGESGWGIFAKHNEINQIGYSKYLKNLLIQIQATPTLSTSLISILPLMLKWFFIPNIFSLYFFAFQLRLCQKRLTWSNGYVEVIFHALDVFSIIFATVYVEVLNRRSHWRHIVCFGYVNILAEVEHLPNNNKIN